MRESLPRLEARNHQVIDYECAARIAGHWPMSALRQFIAQDCVQRVGRIRNEICYADERSVSHCLLVSQSGL